MASFTMPGGVNVDTVETGAQCSGLRRSLDASIFITIDVEFGAGERAALLQLALERADGARRVYLVDLTALLPAYNQTLHHALAGAFFSEHTLKVVHGAKKDLQVLFCSHPGVPAFGKMVHAMELCSVHRALLRQPPKFGAVPGTSLAKLTQLYLGVALDKGQQCSDWDRRPLLPEQREYAACDAYVLLELRAAMMERADAEGVIAAALLEDFNIGATARRCGQCAEVLFSAKALRKHFAARHSPPPPSAAPATALTLRPIVVRPVADQFVHLVEGGVAVARFSVFIENNTGGPLYLRMAPETTVGPLAEQWRESVRRVMGSRRRLRIDPGTQTLLRPVLTLTDRGEHVVRLRLHFAPHHFTRSCRLRAVALSAEGMRLAPTSRYLRPRRHAADTVHRKLISLPRPQLEGLWRAPLPYLAPNGFSSSVKDGDHSHLTRGTYASFFHDLLWVEEAALTERLAEQDGPANLEPVRGDPGRVVLASPPQEERHENLSRGDRVHIIKHFSDPHKWEAEVSEKSTSRAVMRVSCALRHGVVRRAAVQVRHVLGRMPLRLAHQGVALSHLAPDAMLFPASPAAFAALQPELSPADGMKVIPGLNAEQQDAVRRIANGAGRHGAPYCLLGPPGTGKTTTLVQAVLRLLAVRPGARILLAAPSNAAADECAQRLVFHAAWPSARAKLHRLLGHTRPITSVPVPLRAHCAPVADGAFTQLGRSGLRECNVVVCTLAMAARLCNQDCAAWIVTERGGVDAHPQGPLFDVVIIDEACQSTEPDALAAILPQQSPDLQVVLAGDPQQLGPVLQSPRAKRHGLGCSLMERLIGTQSGVYRSSDLSVRPMVCLVRNYRSHPELLRAPNHMYYKGLLQACASREAAGVFAPLQPEDRPAWRQLPRGLLPNAAIPFVFHGVHGSEHREGSDPSWFNMCEAEIVKQYLQQLAEFYGSDARSRDPDGVTAVATPEYMAAHVGVITPYRKQAAKISKLLSDDPLFSLCKIGSVELWQGQERSVVIVSTVRAGEPDEDSSDLTRLGFVSDERRCNVTITRAKALMIVIGDPKRLAGCPQWGRLLLSAKQRGCYKGCQL